MQPVIHSGCLHAPLLVLFEWRGVVCGDISMTGHLGFLLFTAKTLVASPIRNPCGFLPPPLVTELFYKSRKGKKL